MLVDGELTVFVGGVIVPMSLVSAETMTLGTEFLVRSPRLYSIWVTIGIGGKQVSIIWMSDKYGYLSAYLMVCQDHPRDKDYINLVFNEPVGEAYFLTQIIINDHLKITTTLNRYLQRPVRASLCKISKT